MLIATFSGTDLRAPGASARRGASCLIAVAPSVHCGSTWKSTPALMRFLGMPQLRRGGEHRALGGPIGGVGDRCADSASAGDSAAAGPGRDHQKHQRDARSFGKDSRQPTVGHPREARRKKQRAACTPGRKDRLIPLRLRAESVPEPERTFPACERLEKYTQPQRQELSTRIDCEQGNRW
jgi:hypothetical protein